MPTYQYRCTQCGNELEVVQKFTDPALTECDECQGALRKVYNAVGVVFRGSGFYRNDSRTADGKATGTGMPSTDKSASEGSAAASGSGESSGSGGSGSGSSGSGSKEKAAAASSTAA